VNIHGPKSASDGVGAIGDTGHSVVAVDASALDDGEVVDELFIADGSLLLHADGEPTRTPMVIAARHLLIGA